MPTEVTHANIQPTIDLAMGVYGRDLGHVADDVARSIDAFGIGQADGTLDPLRPADRTRQRRS